jgi:hypothetical protein
MITGSSFKILHCGCNTISHVNNKIHFEISEAKDDSLSIRPFFFVLALVVLSLLFF